MQVEKRSGRFSPADILERIFDNGIIIDAVARLSLDEQCAKGSTLIVADASVMPKSSLLKNQGRTTSIATARKALLAAARITLGRLIARCAFEQVRREAT